MAQLDCVYASVAVNASPQCLDWSPASGLVAYGAANAVVLTPSHLTTISDTLVGHQGRVNCVKWVRNGNLMDRSVGGEVELISGSLDQTIRIWAPASSSSSSSQSPSFFCSQTLTGHESSVNVIDAFYYDEVGNCDNENDVVVTTLVASAGSDAAIKIWRRRRERGGGGGGGGRRGGDDGNDFPFECIVNMLPKSFSFSFALRWTLIPRDRGDDERQTPSPTPLLLVAGDDSNLYVYAEKTDDLSSSSSSPSFARVSTLRGHEDWVRSLDVAVVPADGSDDEIQGPCLGRIRENGPTKTRTRRDLLIASAAQDGVVRLWRFQSRQIDDDDVSSSGSKKENREEEGSRGKIGDGAGGLIGDEDGREVRLKSRGFLVGGEDGEFSSSPATEVSVVLESVLVGHEGGVYSACWRDGSGDALLTASMDKTLIIWKLDSEAGVWLDETRVGDVGGNTLGFYGALFGRTGEGENGRVDGSGEKDFILGHDFQGALHLWQRPSFKDFGVSATTNCPSAASWRPRYAVGGHFRSVEDVAWDPFDGGFGLLSVSGDQTTRFHAPLAAPLGASVEVGNARSRRLWTELGRPQVHGYDMTCVAAVAPGFRFVSGADEKVLRVFEAPNQFLDAVENLSGVDVQEDVRRAIVLGGVDGGGGGDGPIMGAAVPALGLSNKAIREGASHFDADEGRLIRSAEEVSLNNNKGLVVYPKLDSFSSSAPPLESDLLQNTLWPEAQKLYGHGNPIFCVAASVDGRVVASASKAAKADEASIFLWGGVDRQWRHLGAIDDAHSLTVTQMAFAKTSSSSSSSPPSSSSPQRHRYRLLSVSRDRTLVLTEITLPTCVDDDDIETRLLFRTNKSKGVHSRIIWSCDWAHDDAFFLTASRDKKLVAWVDSNVEESASSCASFEPSAPATLPDACTAVACAPRLFSSSSSPSSYLAAAGLDNGVIHLMLFDVTLKSFVELLKIPSNVAHHMTVKRLRFRPRVGRAGVNAATAEGVNLTKAEVVDQAPRTEDPSFDSTVQLASCGSDGFLRVYEISEAK